MATAATSLRSGRVGSAILLALILIALLAPWLANADPAAIAGEALRPPDSEHFFGTDDLGRDLFAGVVHGTRTSLVVGFVAAALSGLLAVVVGGTAAMRGGAIDQVLMRGTEFVQALPRFFLIVLIVSLFGSIYSVIILVIGLTTWPATARVFRAQVLSVLGRDFVIAARAAGGSDAAILVRHVLPHARPVVAAEVSYTVGGAILAEAGLSFLGLGDPTIISWGALLGGAQHFVREAWWMSVFPGIAITLTVLGCNLIADSLVAEGRG
jgi:peptide/nickel transport system permease protein